MSVTGLHLINIKYQAKYYNYVYGKEFKSVLSLLVKLLYRRFKSPDPISVLCTQVLAHSHSDESV